MDHTGCSSSDSGGLVMLRLMFWRAMASLASNLLHVRVLLLIIVAAYLVGWIAGSISARGF
jgi:hypothetical protein